MGEVDLVATTGEVLVFVEVKTRRGTGYGTPGESVSPRKQARLARVAAHYAAVFEPTEPEFRFDVIAIVWGDDGSADLEHIEDAFRPES